VHHLPPFAAWINGDAHAAEIDPPALPRRLVACRLRTLARIGCAIGANRPQARIGRLPAADSVDGASETGVR
jgi:hypothetical protein